MRVGIVWNHDYTGVINRFGRSRPDDDEREALESVVAALQEGGHETLLCEGDKELLTTLERFMPPDPQARPSGIVLNMAAGIQGDCRLAHVPAMLEMAGIPYTGSSPLGHGLALDKVTTKRLIRDCGVPTPNFCLMYSGEEDTGDLRYPLIVKPRHEYNSFGVQLVHKPAQLKRAVEAIVAQYAQDALVEEYIEGREITIALLGNEELEVLPLVERDFGERKTHLATWEETPHRICPARIECTVATKMRDISIATFLACQCRDYARVDIRIDHSGQPFVLEINSMPVLSKGSLYTQAGMAAGYSLSSLVNRILDLAHTRYFGIGMPKN
ncbi:D-alanine--D-alanine ligase family protein [Rhizobium mesoamericanum]|uniref:D-alanine--D-alanine ligase family protein n=1 Tax=Rhizobium mesoamericanum TaxID=1079800 RepID=UPI0027D8A92B|nr:ATP-grasp domain-containing protein [Rhizobium mesoamericanum]